MNVNRWKTAAAVLAVAALLGACSDGGDPTPTSAPSGGSSTAAPTTGGDTAEWCEPGDRAESDYTLTFGEMGAASDEWSSYLDRKWRHYLPFTFTNTMDVRCVFAITVDLAVDGAGGKATDGFSVPLMPGQSFSGQMFDLDVALGLPDTESVDAPAALAPSVTKAKSARYFGDYYDLTFEVGEREGVGSAATVPVVATTTAVSEGMPERLSSARDDDFWLLGLDGQGNVITVSRNMQPALKVPGETTTWFAIAGGGSSGYARELMPMSTYDSVKSWTFVAQPVFTNLDK
ncbi:hypothetical protein HF995_03025 [Sanguibacter hominis ATCC BAA-789]|uniref:Tat pathway signal sequence domain protein n=1 Tax=Sanguibacter hominis ATCC BAA-789 TaxID=1312740 RepID=A0A9X5IR26_9MICO|nr:hypothetical protein [Sanguibacter hominis]NKX92253.1 hypothetical protein [Sanguibacter hominis ATCC BAA-789]